MNSNQLVVFTLGKDEYAIDISYAQEIIRIPEFTKLPNMPQFIEGVINLRGKIIPVFNLKKRFDIQDLERGSDSRLLILELGDMRAGIIVDDVSEVMRVSESLLQDIHNELVSISKNSIDKVVIVDQRVIIILNVLKLRDDICIYNIRKEQE